MPLHTLAYVLDAFGKPLEKREVPSPAPQRQQVKLRMHAMSLNYRDHLIATGRYDPNLRLPLVPLSDGVGEVIEVGEDVTSLRVGDRVCPLFAPTWRAGDPDRFALRLAGGASLPGVLALERTLEAHHCAKVPTYLSSAEAATLPCAALTAWSALQSFDPIRAGQTVLVQGTGGVSLFALLFAKAMGARVIVTSKSDDKLQRVIELGADHGINYRDNPKWGREASVRYGEGVDHVIEVGGAATLEESLRAIRAGGTISLIGNLSGSTTSLQLTRILMNQVRVQGVYVGSAAAFDAMCRAIDAHRLRPVLDTHFDFAEANEAFRYFSSGDHFGKVTLEV